MVRVMERYQTSDERAFAFPTRRFQHRNLKLRLVADEIVPEVAGKAEARP